MTQYGLTHISAGDLLRAEVAAGTDAGNKAQECMQEGKLVPNEIVVMVCIKGFFVLMLGSDCHGHYCLAFLHISVSPPLVCLTS
jgi:hypothetical protein